MPPLKSDVHWLSFLLRVKTMVSMAVQLKTQNSLTSGRPAELWALRLAELKKKKLVTYLSSAQSSAPSSPQSPASSSESRVLWLSELRLGSQLGSIAWIQAGSQASAERLRTKKSGFERGELAFLYFFAALGGLFRPRFDAWSFLQAIWLVIGQNDEFSKSVREKNLPR